MYDLMKSRMKEVRMNTHQLSCSCGIPHGYLNSLLNGGIQKPGRDKLIQIGVSLYWDIENINLLLFGYGYEAISKKDISFIMKAVENKGIFAGLNPIYPGTFNFAITIMSVERLKGNVRLVTAGYPHVAFGEKSANYEYDTEKDVLNGYVDEFLFDERKEYFFQNMQDYTVSHLVCRKCFEEKIVKNKTHFGRDFLMKSFRNLFECLVKEQNYDLKLVENCPKFEFHLKEPIHADDKPVTVFAGSLTEHYRRQDKSLVGFVSSAGELYEIFSAEFERLEKFTIEECVSKGRLIQYMVDILVQNGVGDADDYSDYLSGDS